MLLHFVGVVVVIRADCNKNHNEIFFDFVVSSFLSSPMIRHFEARPILLNMTHFMKASNFRWLNKGRESN